METAVCPVAQRRVNRRRSESVATPANNNVTGEKNPPLKCSRVCLHLSIFASIWMWWWGCFCETGCSSKVCVPAWKLPAGSLSLSLTEAVNSSLTVLRVILCTWARCRDRPNTQSQTKYLLVDRVGCWPASYSELWAEEMNMASPGPGLLSWLWEKHCAL